MLKRINYQALWQFSLSLYPRVKPTCLQLQDELGANINLLLLLCYLEQQQLSLSRIQIRQLSHALQPLSLQFTQPLRRLRRQAPSAPLSVEQQQQLKHALLQAELTLEQLEQQLLVQHCPVPLAKAEPLLEIYLSLLQDDSARYNPAIVDLRQAIAQQPE